MKRWFSILTTITLLITVTAGGFRSSAQQPNTNNIPQDPFATPRAKQKEFLDKLPASIKRGATPEAKAAWDKLKPEERERVKTNVHKIFEEAKAKAEKNKKDRKKGKIKSWKDIIEGKHANTASDNTVVDATLLFSDKTGGNHSLVMATEQEVAQRPEDPCIEDPSLCDPGNQPPQVSITASPTSGTAPLAVNFTANASDPDGYITSYYWDFGDGQTASGASVSHTYQTAGNFTASVTVSDDYGNWAGASVVITTNGTPQQGTDADGDTLPESFENELADAFTPIYHVSQYEPDQFATFVPNSVQQIPQALYGQSPVSHFRVKPLGWGRNRYNGQLVSVIRIDYLTLWNQDSGVVTGGACDAFPGLNGFEGIFGHNLDNERSVVLLAAPVSSPNYFNLDPNAYSAYSYYTAAHENTIFDKSRYLNFPTNPIPAGLHIHLALASSKHSTYTFDPDYLPLLPDYIIYGIIEGVNLACYYGTFNNGNLEYNDLLCLAALYYAYGALYGCAVERFINQGGSIANLRINVGEPNNPINSSLFIQNDTPQSFRLYSKLVNPVFDFELY